MVSKELLENFFEEQFNDTSSVFLYKDKQLLKNEQYREFAEEQLRKADKIFWSVLFFLFIGVWYGTNGLIEFGAYQQWFDLALGIGCWTAMIFALLLASKEYYTIKSSMNLFIKLLDEKEQQPNS
ncbi:hypothetical protein [Gracilimonas sp.]|uniref:hypothetical protein n=1 Tax=Gracilimonas sp. TaxID=1974203 RepID=UPI002870DCF0|nr:hypothetical protein [Gracilimonas sp.]